MYFSNVPNIYDLLKIFFPIKKRKLIEQFYAKNNNYKLLSKSSWSISVFCSHISKKKNRKINLGVPSYYCDYALKYIKNSMVNVIYYEIDSNDNIDLDKLKVISNDIDILISVNYFGKKCTNSKVFDFCKINSIYLIEDSTHCILPPSNREFGDIILYSPYKFLGTLSGAILLVNSKGPNKIKDDFFNNYIDHLEKKQKRKKKISIDFIIWFLKKIIQNLLNIKPKIENFDIDKRDNSIESFYPDLMSERLFYTQLEKISNIKNIRKRSYIIWNNLFYNNFKIKNSNLIFEKSFNSYCFIIEDIHKKIKECYEFLKSNNIPVSTWPDLNSKVKINANSFANELRKSRLFLPIHSLKNLNYVNLINSKFNKNDSNYSQEISEIFIKKISNVEYKKLLNKLNYVNLLQTVEHHESKKEINSLAKSNYYEIKYSNNIIGAFQTIYFDFLIFKISILNRGPIFIKDIKIKEKILATLRIYKYFKKLNLHIFIFSPELYLESIKSTSMVKILTFLKKNSWNTQIINLSYDLGKIQLDFSPKIRNTLNKEFIDKEIAISKSEDIGKLKIFLKLLKKEQNKKKYKGLENKYILSLFNQKALHIYYAEKENNILGGVLIAELNDTATYLAGYFDKSFKIENLSYKILFRAISESKKRNLKYFDMGGLDFNYNYNVAKFKQDFGGFPLQLIGKSVSLF